jgi:transcription elongation factor GreA
MDYALRRVELIKIPPKEKRDIVHMGATVVVEVGGKINELEIVGSLETNPSQGRISNESPVGRALLGHRIGDEVVISSSAKAVYTIREINYDSFFR